MEVGDGTLSCVIEDGGVLETASKTIPIILQSLDVRVYPEGGDFINGHECGVYVEAFTPYGEPADLVGDIVDGSGNIVGNIATSHEGRGKSSFTPKKGEIYSLKINKPSGITKAIPFPSAKDTGVSLMSTKDVYATNKIVMSLSAPKGDYIAYLMKRDFQCDSKSISIQDQKVSFELDANSLEGVLRVLVTDTSNNPLAERLVFHTSPTTIDVKITTDYKSYSPGDSATVKVHTTLSDGKNISAVLGVTVTDESVLKSIEERKQAPRLTQMVFLESEVDHFEDANIYLSDHPNSELAVDLLLGTQGWRRFAFMNINDFISLKGEIGERISAYHEGQDLKTLYDDKFNQVKFDDFLDFAPRMMMMEEQIFMAPMQQEMMIESEVDFMEAPVQMAPQLLQKVPEKKPLKEKQAPPKPKAMRVPPKVDKKKIIVQDDKKRAKKKKIMKEEKEMKIMDEFMGDFDDDFHELPSDSTLITRVYAFKKNPNRQTGERTTFKETLYWCSDLVTNTEGEASFSFDLSDSVTSYRIMIDGFREGLFGSKDKIVECKEPFYVEAKLPVEVTVGDTLEIPVVIVNESPEDLQVSLDYQISEALEPSKDSKFKETFDVDSKQRTKKYLELNVKEPHSKANFEFSASAGVFSDKVVRNVDLVPSGFPFEISFGGKLEKSDEFIFSIPKDADSIETNLKFYLKPVGQLQSALTNLLRKPSGCFEQTSSVS
jgi:alpha-2-macroglobulin-like protein